MDLNNFLYEHDLARPADAPQWIPLTGGASSEIWRVDLPRRSLCVKRALPQLKVAAEWLAPVSRNAYEWHWLCFAAQQLPQAVPRPLAQDLGAGLFAMSFLPPEDYPNWKMQLMEGFVEPGTAAQVGTVLAKLHSASANRSDLATQFDSLENFRALRLDPYLLATAARHPDLRDWLQELAERTATTALALVHGDVSPKNILIGRDGPVFLDAECAWYGDPAFDVAFCLNHFLLKCLIRPDRISALLESFSKFSESYFSVMNFESRCSIEPRVAHLLPALMLARVDGKSPVEYLAEKQPEQAAVRRVARSLLQSRAEKLNIVQDKWLDEINSLQQNACADPIGTAIQP